MASAKEELVTFVHSMPYKPDIVSYRSVWQHPVQLLMTLTDKGLLICTVRTLKMAITLSAE